MTSPTNSGEHGSSARLAQREEELDTFEKTVGVEAACRPEIENRSRALLDLSPDELSRLSASECAEAAYALEQFAFHVQKAVNRLQSRLSWAEASLKKIIAPHLGAIQAYAWEERKLLAIRNSEAASAVEAIRVDNQMKLDRLQYLVGKIEALARVLLALQQTKKGKE